MSLSTSTANEQNRPLPSSSASKKKEQNEEPLPKPYCSTWLSFLFPMLFHPHLETMVDLIISLVLIIMVPLYSIARLAMQVVVVVDSSSSSSSSKTEPNVQPVLEKNQYFQGKFNELMSKGGKGAVEQWTKALNQQTDNDKETTNKNKNINKIVEYHLYIPRASPNELKATWGLDIPSEMIETIPSHPIKVVIQFPLSLLPDKKVLQQYPVSNEPLPSAAYQWNKTLSSTAADRQDDDDKEEEIDGRWICLRDIMAESQIPLVLFLHGGGMTVGNAYAQEGLELTLEAAARQRTMKQKEEEDGGGRRRRRHSSLPHFVLASIEYSLAPQHPFPAAISETLTVVEYLSSGSMLSSSHDTDKKDTKKEMKKNKTIPFHLMGVSAGANLATVTLMETLRRRRRQEQTTTTSSSVSASWLEWKSASIFCPMVHPACDTLSFYMQCASWTIASSAWLRWTWSAYLSSSSSLFPLWLTTQQPSHKPKRPMKDKASSSLLLPKTIMSRKERLEFGSHRNAWEAWKVRYNNGKGNLARFVDPTEQVVPPPLASTPSSAIQILVITNRGDALEDDGKDLVQALEQQGWNKVTLQEHRDGTSTKYSSVCHLNHGGTHFFGSRFLPKNWNECVQVFGNMVFP